MELDIGGKTVSIKKRKVLSLIVAVTLSISLTTGCSDGATRRPIIDDSSAVISEIESESESGTVVSDSTSNPSNSIQSEANSNNTGSSVISNSTPTTTPGSGKQVYKDYFSTISFANPVPKSTNLSPSKTPFVISVPTSMPRWQRYMLPAFEGLANRKQSRIFLNWEASDAEWMNRWKDTELYGFSPVNKSVNDVYQMIMGDTDYYNVKGLLIYDDSIINQEIWSMLINVYTGICAAENLIPVPKSQRANFAKLPVIFDATTGGKTLGRWSSQADAYIWVIDTYPILSRKGAPMAIQHPSCLREVDYYVMNKIIPIFYWSGCPQTVKDKFREVFISTGTNGMVVGCWDIPTWSDEHSAQRNKPSMGGSLSFVKTGGDQAANEHVYIHLTSGYGKAALTTAEKGVQNMSFQEGLPLKPSKPVLSPIKPTYSASKKYMTLHVSDGDNMCYVNEAVDGGFGLTTSRWWNEASRGAVNISWSIGPGAVDMLPGVVSYLFNTSSDMDSFVGATSGWGYMLISAYGKFLPAGTDRNAELTKFYKTTGMYQKKLGTNSQHILWSYYRDYLQNRTAELADLAIAVNAMKSTNPTFNCILGEYGKNTRRNIPWQNSIENVAGVPLFNAVDEIANHLLNETSQDYYLNILVNDIKAIPTANQKFMHVFCTNWFVRPNSLEELCNRLGPNYVAVSSNHLGSLYR